MAGDYFEQVLAGYFQGWRDRWRLFIHSDAPGRAATVFLHGHPSLAPAQAAAVRHIGDEEPTA